MKIYGLAVILFSGGVQIYSFYNTPDVSNSTGNQPVGGNTQIWKPTVGIGLNSLTKIIAESKYRNWPMGEGYVQTINRLNCPYNLKPQESTFEDIILHATVRQYLSESTIKKRIQYAKFMGNHQIPIDFFNPDFNQFIKHMDYRIAIEEARPEVIQNEWLTMRMFLKAYGITWDYKTPPRPDHNDIILPFPNTVHELIHHNFSKDPILTKTIQYILFHNFMIGWRVPSEPCNMTLDQVHIDGEHASLTIIERKKRNRKRTIVPEKTIMLSKYRKSFKNYIETVRSKVENQHSGNALYLTPTGKPFSAEYLRNVLYKAGKQVWPSYSPNISRHWCATARYIEWNDIYRVATFLGHRNINRTKNYIHLAEQYYQQEPVSWLKHVLRSSNKIGKHELTELSYDQYNDEISCIKEKPFKKVLRTWREVVPVTPKDFFNTFQENQVLTIESTNLNHSFSFFGSEQ